jgi:hypothetical protein
MLAMAGAAVRLTSCIFVENQHGEEIWMDRWVIPGIMLMSAIGTLASAIAAWRSAYFSSQSSRTAADAARTAADATETGLILRFVTQYASNEMLADLRKLRAWFDSHGGSTFATTWREKLEQGDKEALEVDSARRRVSHFFCAIIDLQKAGLLSDRVKKVVSGFDGFDLVHRVVEPLEEALNPAYNKEYFDKLRELRPQRALGHHAAPKRQRDDQKGRAR